jgi:hypothetical protein
MVAAGSNNRSKTTSSHHNACLLAVASVPQDVYDKQQQPLILVAQG